MSEPAPARPAPRRPGPKRTAPWDAVLDRWAAGELAPHIASALGITRAAVTRIVHRSRARGDARAVRRKAPFGKPGTGCVVSGVWVPYWADPRQIPLPLPEVPAP